MRLVSNKHNVVQLPKMVNDVESEYICIYFQFISDKLITLNSKVSVIGLDATIREIEIAYKDCEYGDALLYTCLMKIDSFNKSSLRKFDLRKFEFSEVTYR